MDLYKSGDPEVCSYEQKEEIYKNTTEEQDYCDVQKEQQAIEKLCLAQEIPESLDYLAYLSSNPDFRFIHKPGSQIITVIIDQMRNFPLNPNIIISCLQFIGNIWNDYGDSLEIFLDEELLELTINLCIQKNSPEIAFCGVRALNNLISATTQKGDEHFRVEKLDKLFFHPNSQNDIVDSTNLEQIISLLDAGSDFYFDVLGLIYNITRTYKKPICKTIMANPTFLSKIDNSLTQNYIIRIICNLAQDDDSFSFIFSPNGYSFAEQFVGYIIKIEDMDTILEMYSVLALFAKNSISEYIDYPLFWKALANHLKLMSQIDITNILNFIESVNYICPELLEKYNFWPMLFDISDEFATKSKERFAKILCSYFRNRNASNFRDINMPPLSYAVNKGFEFLADILEFSFKDTLLFVNIINCLTELFFVNREVFGEIIVKSDLIEKLKNVAFENNPDYHKKVVHHTSVPGDLAFLEGIEDDDDINSLIYYFIENVQAFSDLH